LVTIGKNVDPLYMFHDKMQFKIFKKYFIAKYLLFKSLRIMFTMILILMDFLFHSMCSLQQIIFSVSKIVNIQFCVHKSVLKLILNDFLNSSKTAARIMSPCTSFRWLHCFIFIVTIYQTWEDPKSMIFLITI
jgi:hypothetical protein